MEKKLTTLPKPITLVTRLGQKSSQTLLEFLAKRFAYHTEGEWAARIAEGKIKVNGLAPSENQPLRAGDEVAYTTTTWEEPRVNPHYRPVYEDGQLLVVSKPAPLPVHAIGAYFQNTLMFLLRRDRPEARDFHLVHRLDSETSGLLVLVKDKKYLKTLQDQWGAKGLTVKPPPLAGEGRVRGVIKTYLAIVFGSFPPGQTTVDAPIGPKKGSEIRMKLAVVKNEKKSTTRPVASQVEPLAVNQEGFSPSPLRGEGGVRVEDKHCITEFELLETKRDFSLVQARPLTGRTHQIRVHLEHLGFPIVGDKLYSGNDQTFLHFYENDWDDWLKERVLLPRAALHAYRLEFNHPESGKRMVFEDPLPEDLASFWKTLI